MNKIKKLILWLNKALANFTLAKFCGAIVTVTILALVKYLISGSFHLEYCDFWNNLGIGLLGWTINTGIIAFLTEYLGIKGINFNLNQFLFGLETMKAGDTTKVGGTPSAMEVLEDGKPKLYNAMDSGEGSNTDKKPVSRKGGYKDKGRDVRVHPYPRNGRRAVRSWTFDDESVIGSDNCGVSDTEMEGGPSDKGEGLAPSTSDGSSLFDKGKGIAPFEAMQESLFDKGKGIAPVEAMQDSSFDKGKGIEPANTPPQPPLPIWTKPFSGLNPNAVIFTPKINPGPGFAVPGGVVPINDDICQHIDYNGHILTQFKTMDWHTAMQQRYNYWLCVHNMNGKIAYAEQALSRIPTTPTTELEFKIRNQIIQDIEALNRVKIRSEARATLLDSRLQFIQDTVNNNHNKKD